MKKRFKPTGICPKEIHLDIEAGVLKELNFLGGGCPGNAQLVCRLLKGKPVEELIPLLKGIPCREGTSCPDQVAKALELDQKGGLTAAEMNILTIQEKWKRIGVFSGIQGDLQILKRVLEQFANHGIERLICLGNLTGEGFFHEEIIFSLVNAKAIILQSPSDLEINRRKEVSEPGKKFLSQLPSLLEFQMGDLRAIAFHGGAMEEVPGFSDYGKYGTEINAIVYLSDYLRNEYVFPAFETLAKQFWANLYVFNYTDAPLYKTLQNRHFVDVGKINPAEGTKGSYAILEVRGDQLSVEFQEVKI